MGLSRSEFFARIGLLDEIDPLVELAYRFYAQQNAKQSDQGAAVDDLWHLSFHGSSFPGASERACGRSALYRMMDIPRGTGSFLFSNRKLEQISEAGKDIEDRLVMKWHDAGYLVTPAPIDPFGNKQNQLVFEDARHWLTSTVDAILVWPRSTRMIVCEVKSKYADVVADMRKLIRGPDESHVLQIKTQIGLAKELFERDPMTVRRCFNTGRLAIPRASYNGSDDATIVELCPQHHTSECLTDEKLDAPSYGYIYYVSRDNPADTFSFYVDYDKHHMEEGRARLLEWREAFLAGKLPQTNFEDKRYAHPFKWKWTEQPCKWCSYGDHCREDNRKAILLGEQIALEDSSSVDFAKGVRPDYDLDLIRLAVGKRWGLDGSAMIPSSRSGEEQTDRRITNAR